MNKSSESYKINQTKVKDILVLLPENQETQVHCKDYSYYSSYPFGFLNMGERVRNATVTKIETDYIETCKCTVVKIYTDLKMGK